MLVVDDVHWADAPSLRWLALLARSLGELRIGVLCAVRSGEPAAAPELLAELLASAPEPPVRPRALGPAATETLVRGRLAATWPLPALPASRRPNGRIGSVLPSGYAYQEPAHAAGRGHRPPDPARRGGPR